MTTDNEPEQRLYQMEGRSDNIEYRLQQLENEMLPKKVQRLEYVTEGLQGEVTAVKEIARGISVKLDSGIEKLTTNSAIELDKLTSAMASEVNKVRTEQAENRAFIRGVVWVGGIMVTLISLGPTITEVIKKLIGG